MKNLKSQKREGFTLVELLIVIVVIGILSAMMMLSSTEAVSSARANNIIANLRNLKTAALAFYVDSLDKIADLGEEKVIPKDYIVKYLGSSNNDEINKISDKTANGKGYSGYSVYITKKNQTTKNKLWIAQYNATNEKSDVKNKLAARAASVGLKDGNADGKNSEKDLLVYTANKDKVCMFVLSTQ